MHCLFKCYENVLYWMIKSSLFKILKLALFFLKWKPTTFATKRTNEKAEFVMVNNSMDRMLVKSDCAQLHKRN